MQTTTARVAQLDTVVSGDPVEMGIEQGRELRDKIHAARGVLENLEAFQAMRPKWIPFSIFLTICEHKASRALEHAFAQDFPNAKLRLQGIARGSGCNLRTLYLFTAMEC